MMTGIPLLLTQPRRQHRGLTRCYRIVLLCFCAVLSGCIGSRAIEAPEAYLSPAGWQHPESLLAHDNFSDYAAAVTDEVRRYRMPFDPEQADTEIAQVSPVELGLSDHCEDQPAGIAILVHGLSDTAYSLRDIGHVLSDVCFKSRVVLLPGHGTRSGDLLTTRFAHWQTTLHYLIDQAAAESDTVILVGFSLGGVLTLDAALQRQDAVDGVIGISPAYHLSTSRLARWTPWIAPVIRWIDRGVADDPMRYEAMPTRGVAETWRAMQHLNGSLERYGPVTMPWLLTQSMDDAVIVPDDNETLWRSQAAHPDSRLIRFVSDQSYEDEERTLTLPGNSEADRVIALTHLAIHQSPDNPHYGINGRYRNCGGNMSRESEGVSACETSDEIWYGLWSTEPVPGRAMAYSTFNPAFDQLAREIQTFAQTIAESGAD